MSFDRRASLIPLENRGKISVVPLKSIAGVLSLNRAELDRVPHEPEKTTQPKEEIFDRGFRAWATAFGGFFASNATFGYINAFGVYQDLYTRAGTASSSTISWIGSTEFFFLLGMGIFVGRFLDNGYFRHTVFAGSLIMVLSLFMLSITHTDKYYQIYLSQGLCLGIGAGTIYIPAVAVQAHHWRSRRALAMGIVVAGSATGGIIFPIMLNQLFKTSLGFGWSVRISGFTVLALLFLANLMMSDKSVMHRKSAVNKPKTTDILTDVPYLLTAFSVFIMAWGVLFPYFYLQLFFDLHGINSNIAFYSLTIMNAASLPGRILPNMLADSIGPYNVMIPSCIVCGILLFCMLATKMLGSMLVFTILYGFFSGAFFAVFPPTIAATAKHPSEVGARFGIAYLVTAFGTLTGPPIAGALLGSSMRWSRAIIFSGLITLVGVALLVVARQMMIKRRGSQLV